MRNVFLERRGGGRRAPDACALTGPRGHRQPRSSGAATCGRPALPGQPPEGFLSRRFLRHVLQCCPPVACAQFSCQHLRGGILAFQTQASKDGFPCMAPRRACRLLTGDVARRQGRKSPGNRAHPHVPSAPSTVWQNSHAAALLRASCLNFFPAGIPKSTPKPAASSTDH